MLSNSWTCFCSCVKLFRTASLPPLTSVSMSIVLYDDPNCLRTAPITSLGESIIEIFPASSGLHKSSQSCIGFKLCCLNLLFLYAMTTVPHLYGTPHTEPLESASPFWFLPSVTQAPIPVLLFSIADRFYQSLTNGVAEPRVPYRNDISRHRGFGLNLTFVHTF